MIILKYDAYNKHNVFQLNNMDSLFEDQKVNPNDLLRKNAMEDINRCVTKILAQYPFFGDFIYRGRFLYDHPNVKSMATDGHNYFVNSEYVSKIESDEDLMFVICHEILHVAFMHPTRMKEHVKSLNAENVERWNVAADYEINPHLVDNGIIDMVGLTKHMNGLFNENFRGMTVEEIYDQIGPTTMPEPPQAPDEKEALMMPVMVGSVIKTKKEGVYGVVNVINTDGSYSVKEITKEEARKILNP